MDSRPTRSRRRHSKRRPTRRILLIIVAAVALLAGMALTWKVVQRIRARPDPEFTRLLNEANQAVTEADKVAREATPLFQGMVREVDGMGLERFRGERAAAAAKVAEMLRQAVENFRLGEAKLRASIGRNKDARMVPYLEKKVRSYDLLAQSLEANQEITRLLMDSSIPAADVLPKVLALASRHDDLDRQAQQVTNEANEMEKQILAGGK